MSSDWPAYWPKYLPFPDAIGRDESPVPNRQAVDWPQAQFAPLYLPPGSPSFQPYVYKDGPYPPMQYRGGNTSPIYPQHGPGGDLARLPRGIAAHPFALGDAASEFSMDPFVPLDAQLVSKLSAFNQQRVRTLEERIQTLIAGNHLSGTPQAQMLEGLLAIHARVEDRLEQGRRRRRAKLRRFIARARARRAEERDQVHGFRSRLAAIKRAHEAQDARAHLRIQAAGRTFTPATSAVVTQATAEQSVLLRRRQELVDQLRLSWSTMERFQITGAMQEIKQTSDKLGLPVPTEIPVEVVRIASEAKTNPRSRIRKLRRSKCCCEGG